MAKQIRLFLIRHGETVDNVAQVYAGSRDSELTNHGYQQATRLGQHFKSLGLTFTHIFSSHLQRAAKTAGLIREAQALPVTDGASARLVPDVVQLPALMEQDFGWYEGRKWHERPAAQRGKTVVQEQGFVDMESRESMAQRIDQFLDGHLLPLFHDMAPATDHVVAVVSHGIILSILWKRFLQRLPPRSVTLSGELATNNRISLQHLGGWSNTGYLELHVIEPAVEMRTQPPSAAKLPESGPPVAAAGVDDLSDASKAASTGAPTSVRGSSGAGAQLSTSATQTRALQLAPGWKTVVRTVNGRDHLRGLKRTGGGVGSSRHDASQKNIDSFFKRRRLD